MNVLFVIKSFGIGGVEVVTSILANKFSREGHNVSIIAFEASQNSMESKLDNEIKTLTLFGMSYNSHNVDFMRRFLTDENIDIIINQWGLPFIPIKVISKSKVGLNIKVITVYHNNPSFNSRIHTVQTKLDNSKSRFERCLYTIKKLFFKKITSLSMTYNYKYSDRYMLLSPSYIDEFRKFTGIKNPTHLIVQTNPITIDFSNYIYDKNNKKNEIIYVGRLDYVQKRVDRIIETWKLLEEKHSDWTLEIVGTGEAEPQLIRQANDYGLKNIFFEGYKNPIEYYKRAKILILTSDYEGFPLVIAECMSCGVVPIVYGSYPAVNDIIINWENGLIVEPENACFVKENMAKAVETVMNNDMLCNTMALNGLNTASKDYSIDVVYNQWKLLFDKLV